MEEVWKDIKNYEGLYQVSNKGNVRSLNRVIINKNGKKQFYNGINLKQAVDINGYLKVTLSKNGKLKYFFVHRLVAIMFIGESELEVNHINGLKTDNSVENLEWVTRSENEIHAYKLGLARNTEKQKKAVSEYAKLNYSKSICQYDLNGNLVKIWNSMADASRALSIRKQAISRCCLGKRKTTHGYMWKYNNDNTVPSLEIGRCNDYSERK